MLNEFPPGQISDSFSRLCSINLSNKKKSYLEICNIIEEDKFLFLFLKQTFHEHIGKGGIMTLLNSMGWEGLRNRLVEAYLYYLNEGRYPNQVVLDESKDLVDLERRFDFLTPHGNSRIYLLGMYLKNIEYYLLNNREYGGTEFLGVPLAVDEILIMGKRKTTHPDWLIVIVWSLVSILGDKAAKQLFEQSKGKLNRVRRELAESEYDNFMASLLAYGHGINDKEFFHTIRV